MYGFNPFLWPLIPPIPTDYDVPPTLYAIMNSIANYGKLNKTKIKNLAKATHETIFDFDYPLSTHVSRETFETNILNHYMTRRIGYDTVTAFQIELSNRLNEIMPKYNILFDSMSGWNLFNDGYTETKTGEVTDSKQSSGTNQSANQETTTTSGSNQVATQNSVATSGSASSNNKHSDLPQSELQDITDSSYVNVYEEESNTTSNSSNSSSNSSSTDSSTVSKNGSTNGSDSKTESALNHYNETITHTQSDLASIYIDFQNNVNSIYTMIYKDLDCLFYGLI